MATATVTSRTVITEITLGITGFTIDTGEHDQVPVTALRLTYRDAEISAIWYDTVEDGQPSSAVIHPDFIGRPEAWPDWVREQVEWHRPA